MTKRVRRQIALVLVFFFGLLMLPTWNVSLAEEDGQDVLCINCSVAALTTRVYEGYEMTLEKLSCTNGMINFYGRAINDTKEIKPASLGYIYFWDAKGELLGWQSCIIGQLSPGVRSYIDSSATSTQHIEKIYDWSVHFFPMDGEEEDPLSTITPPAFTDPSVNVTEQYFYLRNRSECLKKTRSIEGLSLALESLNYNAGELYMRANVLYTDFTPEKEEKCQLLLYNSAHRLVFTCEFLWPEMTGEDQYITMTRKEGEVTDLFSIRDCELRSVPADASITPTPPLTPTEEPTPTLSPTEPASPTETEFPTPTEKATEVPTATPTQFLTEEPTPTLSLTEPASPTEPASSMEPASLTKPLAQPSAVAPGNREKAVKGLKVKLTEQNKVKLSWKKTTGVSSYLIYRSRKKQQGYIFLQRVSSGKNTYVDKGAKKGKRYYYRVATDVSSSVGKSDTVSIFIPELGKPAIRLRKGIDQNTRFVEILLTQWDGTFAEIYVKKNKKYLKLKTEKRSISYFKNKYCFRYQKRGITLRFKVRTYKKKNNKRIYSAYSEVKKIRT